MLCACSSEMLKTPHNVKRQTQEVRRKGTLLAGQCFLVKDFFFFFQGISGICLLSPLCNHLHLCPLSSCSLLDVKHLTIPRWNLVLCFYFFLHPLA